MEEHRARTNHHSEQLAEELTHIAAQYLAREAGRETLLTVMRTHLTSDSKRAIIFVSVFPDSEGELALKFLERHERPFRDYLKQHARLSNIPHVRFALDDGEANRRRLDELSAGL